MAYKACFACELLFEVDLGLGESTRCPQCGGVLSDYDPSADELDGKARDVAPAPTQANQAIVRTMSYKGLADAVKAQIGAQEGGGQDSAPSDSGRPVPRARGPVPRARVSAPRSSGRAPVAARPAAQIPARPPTLQGRAGGLIPARPVSSRGRPATDALGSLSGDPGEEVRRSNTAPIGSINAPADELLEDTPLPQAPRAVPVTPLAARPVIAPADAPRGTKVLDTVDPDDDATALDAASASMLGNDSMVEDISMQSMVEDVSMLEDISMQSMVEPIPTPGAPYDLPATVALVQDPARPLPPIPGAPAAKPAPQRVSHVDPLGSTEAQPAPNLPPIQARPAQAQPIVAQPIALAPARPMPQPAMPRAAMPQPVMPRPAGPQPAMPQPAMPQPVMPRPAGPQPVAARPASPVGVAPNAAPVAPGDGASAFAPVDFDHAVARKGRSKLPLIIALVVVLLAAVGGGVWFFVLRDADPEPTVDTPPPPPELTWSEKLEAQIQAGQAPLPTVESAAPLAESTWIAGGPEGMSTSLGLVTGMATSVVRQGAAQSDDSGSWLPVVQKKLAEGSPTAEATLLLGFPAETTVADFLLMADAGRRAGYGQFAMVVEEGADSGKLSQLPFVLAPKDAPPVSKGIIKVGIGTLGLHVTARDATGSRLGEGQAEGEPAPEPRVPRVAGALDLDGFATRLTALKTAQPEIERVVIFPAPEMKLGDLAPMLARIYRGSEGKRFAEIALVP